MWNSSRNICLTHLYLQQPPALVPSRDQPWRLPHLVPFLALLGRQLHSEVTRFSSRVGNRHKYRCFQIGLRTTPRYARRSSHTSLDCRIDSSACKLLELAQLRWVSSLTWQIWDLVELEAGQERSSQERVHILHVFGQRRRIKWLWRYRGWIPG